MSMAKLIFFGSIILVIMVYLIVKIDRRYNKSERRNAAREANTNDSLKGRRRIDNED